MNKPGICYIPFGTGFGFFLIGFIKYGIEQSKCAADTSYPIAMMVLGLLVMLIGATIIKTTPKTSEENKDGK